MPGDTPRPFLRQTARLSRRLLGIGGCGVIATLFLWMSCCSLAVADDAPFDLAGPMLEVMVTRGGVGLPLRQVPTLQPGDQIAVRLRSTDLPHAIVVVAFLRGAANPPPKSWFFQGQTWGRPSPVTVRATVPPGAEQAMVLFAPATSGDFDTIVDAVSGQPGAFVRASQSLNETSRERMRLDAYVRAITTANVETPTSLPSLSPMLARSLLIKLDPDCLAKSVEQQAGCLTEGGQGLVLSDGRDASLVQTLTSGVTADLVQQISATPKAGQGYYSPYISSIMDIARLLDGFHTAQYQYIPALTLTDPAQDPVRLMLNTPPSFYNPKSVIVAALPPIVSAKGPAFRSVEPDKAICFAGEGAVVPIEGAPIAFATAFAHDLGLDLHDGQGRSFKIPVVLDPAAGGLVAKRGAAREAAPVHGGTARLVGHWGFDTFEGPEFHLDFNSGAGWQLDARNASALVVGQKPELTLKGEGGNCLNHADLRLSDGRVVPLDVKSRASTTLVLTAPLEGAVPGDAVISLGFRGGTAPVRVPATVFSPLPSVKAFHIHEGDAVAVVQGDHVGQIKALSVSGQRLAPVADGSVPPLPEGLAAFAVPQDLMTSRSGLTLPVEFMLADGRSFTLPEVIEPRRPAAALLSKSVLARRDPTLLPIDVGGNDLAPLGATVTFSIRAITPMTFSKKTVLELTVGDGQTISRLTTQTGLILEDDTTAIAQIDTEKAFDPSTHGQLRYRVTVDGVAGDWQPVTNIVRFPRIRSCDCATGPGGVCHVQGEQLYLIHAIAADAAFQSAVLVPPGLTAGSVTFPSGGGRTALLHLRDRPDDTLQIGIGSPK